MKKLGARTRGTAAALGEAGVEAASTGAELPGGQETGCGDGVVVGTVVVAGAVVPVGCSVVGSPVVG